MKKLKKIKVASVLTCVLMVLSCFAVGSSIAYASTAKVNNNGGLGLITPLNNGGLG